MNIKKLIISFYILLMIILLFSQEGEILNDHNNKDLINSIKEAYNTETQIKSLPKGMNGTNFVTDEFGYFWYIYKNNIGNFTLMRYDGFNNESIKTIDDEQISLDGNFVKQQKAFRLKNGNLVFLSPHCIIVKDKIKISVQALEKDDKILNVFRQNGKIVVIANNAYYIIGGDEIKSVLMEFPLINHLASLDLKNITDVKKQILLLKNQKLLSNSFNTFFTMGSYKYNSSSNFFLMSQLRQIDSDYYLNVISNTTIDSIFVLSNREYNDLINPLVVPVVFSDSEHNSLLYFKYTNYLYDIDAVSKKANKISISPEMKIIKIFTDNNSVDWVIHQDENNLYFTELDSFRGNDFKSNHYRFTKQEVSSGGSFCIYWENSIHMFITKGTLNNEKFSEDDTTWKKLDYTENFQLNYIKYLRKDINSSIKEMIEFIPGFEESNLSDINYSDNMLICKEKNEATGVTEIYFYDLHSGQTIVKKIFLNNDISRFILNRKKNLIIKIPNSLEKMQLHFDWQESNFSLQNESVKCFINNVIVVENTNEEYLKIYDFDNNKVVLRDSLIKSKVSYIDKLSSNIYFTTTKEEVSQIGKYDLNTGTIDSLLCFPKETILVFSINEPTLLSINNSQYQLIEFKQGSAQIIKGVDSTELYSLVMDEVPEHYRMFENKLFIDDKKIYFDLLNNVYEFKKNWIKTTSIDSLIYILYKDFNNNIYEYRVSRFENNMILKDNNDFIYKSAEEIEPINIITSNGDYFPIFGSQIFYINDADIWKMFTINMPVFSDYFFFSNTGRIKIQKTPSISIVKNGSKIFIGNCYDFFDDFVSGDFSDIAVIDPASDLVFSYNKKHGVPENIKQIFTTNNNDLYARVSNGSLNTGQGSLYQLNKSLLNPTLDISWLEVNGERKDLSKPLKFASTENNITIPVAILNYMYPEDYPMKYKLTGFDKDWKVGTYDGKISYENLNPGKYAFDVQAFPTDFSDMSWPTIEFRILPPWYRAWWAYCSYALFLGLVIYLIFKQRVKLYKKNQELLENKVTARTHELTEKTTELTEKTVELTEQQKKMRESIEYASLIQRSILPQATELKSLFNDYFVIWKPRDIVGGDFYWLYDNPEDQVAYLSIIDCTGHGVPGALLSMTVNSLLNHTIKDQHIISPAEIIQQLHQEICFLMHQKAERSVQDGFEIALVKFDFASKTITYSGAGLNILIQEPDKGLLILKGDRYNVGGQKLYANINFTEKSYTYLANTKIYLYSDGIIDQPIPNSERVKRLGYKGWIETINSLQGLAMTEQSDKLNGFIEAMLKEHEQRDDITIMGVEI